MLQKVVDPFRLMTVLPLRLTRHAALRVARGARGWERLIDRALTEPVLQWGWEGTPAPAVHVASVMAPTIEAGRDDEAPAPAAMDGQEVVVDLTDHDLADWGQMPFAAATAKTRELEPDGLRHLLAYEREHGHRLRFEQLLRRRLDARLSSGTG